MSNYNPYPAYKDSGVEWIGEVPEHWEVKPIKIIASCNDDSLPESFSPDTPIRYVDISSVSHDAGIAEPEFMLFGDAPSRARRKARAGDVVVSTVRTYLKAVAAVDDAHADCVYSTGFAVLRPRKEHLTPEFLKWLALNELLIQAVESHSEGLSYPAINASELINLKTTLPSLSEQARIASILDRETARIDALIAKKTRFIELLKEKRQALITHAVTKGLDPNVKMKDSGVAWIGEVPEHWEVKPIKIIASCNDDSLPESFSPDTPIRYVDISSVSHDAGIAEPEFMLFGDAPSRARRKARAGDVVVSTVRTYLKAVAAVDDAHADCVYSTGFAVLRPRKEHLTPEFLKWLALNELLIQAVESHSEGLSYPAINASELINLKTTLPSLSEQARIASILDRETARIDALIAKKTRFIELLKEKRQALITHAVTKGLDPNVKMKDSGVEWIGEVPEHWATTRLKHVSRALIGLTYAPEDVVSDGSGITVLRSSNIQDGQLDLTDIVQVRAVADPELMVRVGDILICSRNGSRALIGKNILLDERSIGCTFGAFMTVIRGSFNDFLYYVFNSTMFDANSALYMTSTVNQLTISMIANMEIPLPPEKEQRAIVSRLRKGLSSLDALLLQTQRSIDLLKERRSAFITAAVTGQIDLRGAA